jgi:hypothetical protein
VQLTRTSFQTLEAVHRTSVHSTPRILSEIRRPLLTVALFALLLGAPISPANSQSSGAPREFPPSGEHGERRMITTEPTPPGDGDRSSAPSSNPRRAAPWRGWPGGSGFGVNDDWTMDGAPSYGPDGRMCWPHGDHVHCR